MSKLGRKFRDPSSEGEAKLPFIPRTQGRSGQMPRLVAFLDRLDAEAERRMQVHEFEEICLTMLRLEGCTEPQALDAIKVDKAAVGVEAFEGRAVDLFRWRHRLTTGEWAIDPAVFDHSLDVKPRMVINDSIRWAAMQANGLEMRTNIWHVASEQAMTLPISDAYFDTSRQ